MASLSWNTVNINTDNGVASIDFTKDVLLQDDSNREWPLHKRVGTFQIGYGNQLMHNYQL